ncbi:MAG TPA: hypothetical protein PLP34_01685 [Chitinophagaceae bacterium]|nr:hypothetical protein [Chitinophagaceae bacterium]
MKKLMFMLAMLMGFVEMQAGPKITITATFEVGRPKFDCQKGIWFCHVTIKGGPSAIRSVDANLTDNGDGTVSVELLGKLPETGTSFFGTDDEALVFPSEIARMFGYNSLEFIPGTYRIEASSKGNFGTLRIRIRTT